MTGFELCSGFLIPEMKVYTFLYTSPREICFPLLVTKNCALQLQGMGLMVKGSGWSHFGFCEVFTHSSLFSKWTILYDAVRVLINMARVSVLDPHI